MDVNGLVESKSGLSGVPNQPPGGGPITLTSACKLTVGDTGKVSSEGRDPGADLVHLEGCDVFVYGIVQSIASGGHVTPVNPPNHCNLDTAAHPPGIQNFSYNACVEIWANNIIIDNTGTHKGEVSADGIRTDAGNPKRAWIDLLAKRDITIIASTTGNYAVHANPPGNTNQFGGLINVKSQIGKIVTTALVPGTVGLALQANATGGGRQGRRHHRADRWRGGQRTDRLHRGLGPGDRRQPRWRACRRSHHGPVLQRHPPGPCGGRVERSRRRHRRNRDAHCLRR